jgi:hypothetical protein
VTGSSFLDIGLLIAVLCGCSAILVGNRTAIPLLVSVFVSLGLIVRHIDLGDWGLFAIDIVTIALIAHLSYFRRSTDILIVVLFIVSWSAQVEGGYTRYYGTWGVVIAQLLLTFPLDHVRAFLARRRKRAIEVKPDDQQMALSCPLLASSG